MDTRLCLGFVLVDTGSSSTNLPRSRSGVEESPGPLTVGDTSGPVHTWVSGGDLIPRPSYSPTQVWFPSTSTLHPDSGGRVFSSTDSEGPGLESVVPSGGSDIRIETERNLLFYFT